MGELPVFDFRVYEEAVFRSNFLKFTDSEIGYESSKFILVESNTFHD